MSPMQTVSPLLFVICRCCRFQNLAQFPRLITQGAGCLEAITWSHIVRTWLAAARSNTSANMEIHFEAIFRASATLSKGSFSAKVLSVPVSKKSLEDNLTYLRWFCEWFVQGCLKRDVFSSLSNQGLSTLLAPVPSVAVSLLTFTT